MNVGDKVTVEGEVTYITDNHDYIVLVRGETEHHALHFPDTKSFVTHTPKPKEINKGDKVLTLWNTFAVVELVLSETQILIKSFDTSGWSVVNRDELKLVEDKDGVSFVGIKNDYLKAI